MIDFLLRPLRRNFGRDKAFYRIIDDMFGIIPHNIELYKLALIHKSASFVLDNGQQINNERLEFLGDSVIQTVVSDYIYIEFPDEQEGFMTQLRSKIVSRQSHNTLALDLGIDQHLISSTTGNIVQKHIYGDAFEAMIGAIYLDQGYEFVNRLLINKIFYKYLSVDTLCESETDFKSRLIEWSQKNRHTISFRITYNQQETRHNPTFYATVIINGLEMGRGVGSSKKEAEQRAAQSVADSMSDEACDAIMEKVDKLTDPS